MNPAPGYSVNPDPSPVTISYKIKWDTGISVPDLDKAAADKGFKVTVNPQGARAPEGVVVTIYVKIEDGPEGKYTIGAAERPIPRDAGTNDFTIDKPTMTTFATSLLTDALKVAPPGGKVGKIDVYKITATPVIAGAPSKADGPEQTLDGKLVLTLKRVIGEHEHDGGGFRLCHGARSYWGIA